MASNVLIFQIGSVVLGQQSGSLTDGNAAPFELPHDGLPIEWFQKYVITCFPGGYKSAQALGEFIEPVSWTGLLLGSNAEDRSFQLKQLESSAQTVTLIYAGLNIVGVVTKYKATYKSQFEIEYSLTFEPLQDNSSPSTGGGGNTISPNTMLANAQAGMVNQVSAPASGYTFPTSTQTAVANLNSSLNSVLQSNGNNIAQATPAQATMLQGQVSSIQSSLQPLMSGTDPVAASAANDLNGSLGSIASSLQGSSNILTTQNVLNPDLYQMATLYYGDPGQWKTIADQNPAVMSNPYPQGTYSLVIPNNIA